MDLRTMSNTDRDDPFLMISNNLKHDEKNYLKRVVFLDQLYSLSEVENHLFLFKKIGKKEDFSLKFLNLIEVKELKNRDLLVQMAIHELIDDFKNNSENKEYLIKEVLNKTKTLNGKELSAKELIPKSVVISLESELDKKIKELKSIKSSDLFVDLISDAKNIIKATFMFLKENEIKNIKELNIEYKHLEDNNLIVTEILSNEHYFNYNKKAEELSNNSSAKLKKRIDIKRSPTLKPSYSV